MMARQRPPSGSTALEVPPPRQISLARSQRMLDGTSQEWRPHRPTRALITADSVRCWPPKTDHSA